MTETPLQASPAASERRPERQGDSGVTLPARKLIAPSAAGSSSKAAPPEPDRAQAKQLWYAALTRKLREMRSYPPVARRLGQEGVVTMAIEIGANGELRLAEVRQGSGFPMLDQAAKALVREAVAALRGQLAPPGNSRLEVPVAYRLD
ncbi:MAG: energy transducer TonB [Candidatus Competibacter denitrificans]